MTNRASRRRQISQFRHAAKDDLMTTLVAADDASVDDFPSLSAARSRWRFDAPRRKPMCVGCGANFSSDNVKPGGFLFAEAVNSGMVSVSAYCRACWNGDNDLTKSATRVLRRVVRRGRFVD
jgi:hypothetical protein